MKARPSSRLPRARSPVPGAPRRLRAVVTDVDGTLTDARRRLDPLAFDWVLRLEARRIPVVLATGNVLPISLALHRFLGLSGPIVAENGGLICWSRGGRETVERLADRRVAERAFRSLTRQGVPVRRLFTDRWRESEIALEPTVSVAAIRRHLDPAAVHVESTGFAIHLMEPGRGKLPALERALAPLGLAPRDCVILGDGDNDVQMLRAAGFGVSFPSASRRARAAADFVTHARFGRGFVEGLKASHILG